MKAWACKWSDGISVCFADTIEEAMWKFDTLGQAIKIYEIDLNDIVLDRIEFNGSEKATMRINKLGLSKSIIKKTFSYKQTWNALQRAYSI